ncbi:FAD-dependent monooxygenase [Streptomyces sp. NPDC058701]|uniref:FAD-dependent monooxygenase n=1 Tax=Streptomyces sp. NPDC058701 TaxID=3346608 RepID=UPI00365479CF
MRVVIAGAGVGGLTTALSLHAAGVRDINLLENHSRRGHTGTGLNVLPNAVRELDALGVLGELTTKAVLTQELLLCSTRGDVIWREKRGRSAGYGWPQLSLSRDHLLDVLTCRVRSVLGSRSVVYGHRVTAFHTSASGVTVVARTAGGAHRTLHADVLVGADGIRSALRAQLYPGEGSPPTNGMVMFRGITAGKPFLTGASMMVLGDERRRLVVYPIQHLSSGEVLNNWVVAVPATAETRRERLPQGRRLGILLSELGHWRSPYLDTGRMLAGAPRIHRYPMIDRESLPRWSFRHVTLVGDAAHAMHPAGSNGATQAIIDARVLAYCLARGQDVSEALAQYEELRRHVMTALQRENRSMGPERVITLAHERAPDGFDDVSDVFTGDELAAISAQYARAGSFAQADLIGDSPWTAQGSHSDKARDTP